MYRTRRAAALTLVVGALLAAAFLVTRRGDRTPAPGSAAYEEITRVFYRGLASLQVGLLDSAREDFARTTTLAPTEPAAWANLGLTHLRLGEIDAAVSPVERAAALAPDRSDIALLAGRLELARGRLEEALARFRRAAELDPADLRARFALAEEIERAGGPDADTLAQQEIDALVQRQPENLALLLERTRLAAKRADLPLLQDSVRRLEPPASGWPAASVEQYRALQQAAAAQDFAAAARAVTFLRNVTAPLPAFQESLLSIRTPPEMIAEPFDRFLRLEPARPLPSPADEALAYTREPIDVGQPPGLPGPGVRAADSLLAISLDGDALPTIVAADLALDWNNDFRTDLVLVGPGGVRLLTQGADGTFSDVTAAASGGSPPVAGQAQSLPLPAVGAWAADVEMDGDLDIVLGLTEGTPVVLRNNGDGTWSPMQPFTGISGLRAFAWADLDRDGDPDAVMLDAAGDLHLLENRQAGDFRAMPGPPDRRDVLALAVGDANGDGVLDLVTLDASGAIRRASATAAGWDDALLATWDAAAGAAAGSHRLFLADLDNNGALDLVASGAGGSAAWLAGEGGVYRSLALPAGVDVFGVADLNADGVLDLAALEAAQPVRLLGRGALAYHWQVIRPRAQPLAGDQRINSFGVGGEIEIRSGLLTQKQILTGAPVHFGLGARAAIDVARIVWPNGVMQAEFDPAIDGAIVAEQRLKGSCPWVFAYDGTGMRFVTDFLWRSPLGLRINAQDTAGVTQTEDWVKIRGDQLRPRDGHYDVRITAELWETHFIDHVALLVVDHPEDVEVYVDERFAREAPALEVHVMRRPRAVARAWDEAGRDVTDLVARQDGRYLATFERGPYQGIAEEHFVEFEVDEPVTGSASAGPDSGPTTGAPRWLVAHGWIYPTDSSINVAIGQGGRVQPRGLSLEALDASGRWVVVASDLGFPAGKNKTILIDLARVRAAGVARASRLRLRTNLEIYWDWLASADAVESPTLRTERLQPSIADLRFRGFSYTEHAQRDVPETPAYDRLANTAPRWRDLVGYYTRFGDVRELVGDVDDRYVIMNAGDELQLRFPAPPPPPEGWTRDFVLVGDGWEKDGDFNTSFSQTVEPLPSHDRPEYGRVGGVSGVGGVGVLEGDPIYRRHRDDWHRYHTRYVTPRIFLEGLRANERLQGAGMSGAKP